VSENKLATDPAQSRRLGSPRKSAIVERRQEIAVTSDLINRLAKRYLWWKSVPTNEAEVDRLIIQVMDIGDFDDTNALIADVGQERFSGVLRSALPGQIRPKAWTYWHYRLGLTKIDATPPQMSVRTFR